MNKKSGHAIRIVLGGYLTYLGIRILMEMIQKRPSNMTLMSVLAVLFILVGVAYAGNSICKVAGIDLKKLGSKKKKDTKETEQVEETTAETQNVEKSSVTDDTLPIILPEAAVKPEQKPATEAKPDQETASVSRTEDVQKEEIKETKVADVFAEAVQEQPDRAAEEVVLEDEAPVSEDAENDFEEK